MAHVGWTLPETWCCAAQAGVPVSQVNPRLHTWHGLAFHTACRWWAGQAGQRHPPSLPPAHTWDGRGQHPLAAPGAAQRQLLAAGCTRPPPVLCLLWAVYVELRAQGQAQPPEGDRERARTRRRHQA